MGQVVAVLEAHNWVGNQVAQVNLFAFLLDVRVLARQEPAYVGEEETALGVVRIGVGFAVLVVDSVVAAPLEDGVFEGQRLHAGQ